MPQTGRQDGDKVGGKSANARQNWDEVELEDSGNSAEPNAVKQPLQTNYAAPCGEAKIETITKEIKGQVLSGEDRRDATPWRHTARAALSRRAQL